MLLLLDYYLSEIRAYNVRHALPSPGKTALLVIDMQRYFEGISRPILGKVLGLVDACRAAGILSGSPTLWDTEIPA
jgi:isochorismate hydrolase